MCRLSCDFLSAGTFEPLRVWGHTRQAWAARSDVVLCLAGRVAFVLQVDDFLRVLARLGLKVAFLQRRWRLGFELLYSVDTSPADGIGAQFWVLHHEFLMLRFRAAFLLDKLSVLYVVF